MELDALPHPDPRDPVALFTQAARAVGVIGDQEPLPPELLALCMDIVDLAAGVADRYTDLKGAVKALVSDCNITGLGDNEASPQIRLL